MNARAFAVSVLIDWARDARFPDRRVETRHQGRAFVMELTYGVVKQRRLLDSLIDRLAARAPSDRARVLLWAGLYQVLFMDRTADYAAVDETVSLARQQASRPVAGFINAVLRRAVREREALFAMMAELPPAVRLSHPDDLFDDWCNAFGVEAAEALCAWNNTRPEVVVCVHRPEHVALFRAACDAAGVAVQPHAFRPDRCFVLPRGMAVPDAPGYAEGWFGVQDPSTLCAVELLDARPGEAVLDACASPGGKTLALAGAMGGEGRLVAADRHADRLDRLRENLARAQVEWVEVRHADARTPDPTDVFDAVLVDVPCSNTGVLRRRPDARWRMDVSRAHALRAQQTALLDGAAAAVRPGGRMVYSTCSLEREENDARIDAWLARHPAWRRAARVDVFPPRDGCDGAFAVRLERTTGDGV